MVIRPVEPDTVKAGNSESLPHSRKESLLSLITNIIIIQFCYIFPLFLVLGRRKISLFCPKMGLFCLARHKRIPPVTFTAPFWYSKLYWPNKFFQLCLYRFRILWYLKYYPPLCCFPLHQMCPSNASQPLVYLFLCCFSLFIGFLLRR